ncbi:hypothetical protein AMECASPLE_036067 [Ameca splendens]|uniref:Dishevelled C-terminal domain-containing protein n=1 Tax=Ameca splendens TaxID=208324 RepID=A0ABV0Z761_9TELE
MANLSLNDDGSNAAPNQDTLNPQLLPGTSLCPMMHTFPYQWYVANPYFNQPPSCYKLSMYSYAPGSMGSQHSKGCNSSSSTRSEGEQRHNNKGPCCTKGGRETSHTELHFGSSSESEYSIRGSLRHIHSYRLPASTATSRRCAPTTTGCCSYTICSLTHRACCILQPHNADNGVPGPIPGWGQPCSPALGAAAPNAPGTLLLYM